MATRAISIRGALTQAEFAITDGGTILEPGSGVFDLHQPWVRVSEPAARLEPSATMEVEAHSDEVADAGHAIARLGLGQSPFPPPSFLTSVLRAHAGETDYLPCAGLPALRDAIAAHYRNWQGLRLVPDDVVVGPGSKGLIFLLQLAFDGEVLIPTPGWVSYAPQAELLGHRVRGIPTAGSDGWRLDPETLDRLCEKMPRRPRLLILNYPLNPSGTTLGATRLRALAEVARKHELLVLSDEIYGRLQHRGKHHSIARFYPEGTIVSGGLSKWAGAGGWRLGHLAFPKHLRALRETVTAAASESFTSTCAPVQYAAEAAYTREHATRPYLDAVRAVLGSLARELVARLRRARVDVATPEGGFYLFPSFAPLRGRLAQRGIHDDRELCRSIETTCAVGLVPGSKFGRSPTELTARLAYVDFDGEAALRSASWRMSAGTPLDAEWVHAYCGPTEDGVSRICAWLDGD